MQFPTALRPSRELLVQLTPHDDALGTERISRENNDNLPVSDFESESRLLRFVFESVSEFFRDDPLVGSPGF